ARTVRGPSAGGEMGHDRRRPATRIVSQVCHRAAEGACIAIAKKVYLIMAAGPAQADRLGGLAVRPSGLLHRSASNDARTMLADDPPAISRAAASYFPPPSAAFEPVAPSSRGRWERDSQYVCLGPAPLSSRLLPSAARAAAAGHRPMNRFHVR